MNTLPKSTLTKSQKKVFTKRITYDGIKADLVVSIRHDDQCGNGHNSFSVTGDIYKHGRRDDSAFLTGGCIHDEIEKHMPELTKYIKWHLTSTDEPMHYVANSLYHARTVTHEGKQPGDPVSFNTRLTFDYYPFTFKEHKKGFWDYLNEVGDWMNIDVEPVKYDGEDNYDFSPNYSLTGFIKENELKKWYKAPFKSEREATEFLAALRTSPRGFIKIPTKWCEPVEPNLEHARSCAVWPEAELKDFTKEKLEARLPALMTEFKKDVESLGFVY